MDFNKNNKSESREDTLIERDAAPICDELLLEKSPICDSAPGEMSEQSQYNTLNVHNDNQRVLMQISNANSVHFGHVININSGKSEVCESKREDTSCSHKHFKTKTFNKKTTTIDIMMNSLDKPTHKIIDAIATHLGSGWKDVMRVLGFSDGQISQSELDNHLHGTKEIVYQLLQDWVRNVEEQLCTIGYLTNVLWKSGQCECVYRMKNIYKLEFMSKIR